MPLYSSYGLTLDSELPFPELLSASSSAPALSLRLGEVKFAIGDSTRGRVLYKPLSREEVIVHYEGVGTALVENGAKITLNPHPKADPLTVRLFVLQQVIGALLLQRGYFVLHASAAAIYGRAVAFAGPSGLGKSTILAALNQADFSIVTDDVLAIDTTDAGKPLALPGLVQLKLTEETRAEIASRIVAEQNIGDRSTKTLCEVDGVRINEPVPLAAIYILEEGSSLNFTPVSKARAAIELVRHTYGSRLLQAIDLSARHFGQSAALARHVPIRILSRPRDLMLLPGIVAAIKRQLPS